MAYVVQQIVQCVYSDSHTSDTLTTHGFEPPDQTLHCVRHMTMGEFPDSGNPIIVCSRCRLRRMCVFDMTGVYSTSLTIRLLSRLLQIQQGRRMHMLIKCVDNYMSFRNASTSFSGQQSIDHPICFYTYALLQASSISAVQCPQRSHFGQGGTKSALREKVLSFRAIAL